MASISASQRYTVEHPCPVCGGYEKLPRGTGQRCHGFLSADSQWAHCSREDHAGSLPRKSTSDTFAHKLTGDCGCGVPHAPTPTSVNGHSSKSESVYNYHDENGKLRHQVLRYPDKSFKQRQPDGNGSWKWNLKDVVPVPYQLPEVLGAEPNARIYITEGEKDSDNLAALGLTATTNPGGAGKWRAEFNEYFRGRHVTILPDNDEAGRSHATKVAQALTGIAATVRLVELPNLPPKGDVSDWLSTGGTVEELERLIDEAPVWEPGTKDQPAMGLQTTTARVLMSTHFEPMRWAVRDLIAVGLTLLAGRPKVGKSWLALDIGVAVATGGRACGRIPVEQGDVLYLALEDTKRRLKDRLLQVVGQGSFPDRLEFVAMDDNFPRLQDGGLARIAEWLDVHPDARLIIIDTLKKVRPPHRVNGSHYDQDYDSVDGLIQLAGQRGVAVVVVHHTRKATADDAIAEVSGSFGLTANVDTVLVFKRAQGSKDGTLHVTGRDVGDQEIALQWDADRSQWAALGDAATMRMSNERQEVLDVLADGPMRPNEIVAALGKHASAVRKLLRQMLQSGQVCQLDDRRYSIERSVTSGNAGNSGNSSNSGNAGNGSNSGNASNISQADGGVTPSVTFHRGSGVNSNRDRLELQALPLYVEEGVTSVTAVTAENRGQALSSQQINSETDYAHDKRCSAEVDGLLAQGKTQDAKVVASRIRGRKDQQQAWERIDAAGVTHVES